MLQQAIRCSQDPDYLHKTRIVVNREADLIRPETEEDPTRRGQRKYKNAIREIKLTLGEDVSKMKVSR